MRLNVKIKLNIKIDLFKSSYDKKAMYFTDADLINKRSDRRNTSLMIIPFCYLLKT